MVPRNFYQNKIVVTTRPFRRHIILVNYITSIDHQRAATQQEHRHSKNCRNTRVHSSSHVQTSAAHRKLTAKENPEISSDQVKGSIGFRILIFSRICQAWKMWNRGRKQRRKKERKEERCKEKESRRKRREKREMYGTHNSQGTVWVFVSFFFCFNILVFGDKLVELALVTSKNAGVITVDQKMYERSHGIQRLFPWSTVLARASHTPSLLRHSPSQNSKV